jgi:hypothetical protein
LSLLQFFHLILFHFSGDKQKAAGVVGAAVGGNTQQQNPQQQSDQDPSIAFIFSQLRL